MQLPNNTHELANYNYTVSRGKKRHKGARARFQPNGLLIVCMPPYLKCKGKPKPQGILR